MCVKENTGGEHTFPRPISQVFLSADRVTCLMLARDIWTPVVLDQPGFDACPPDLIAKGVRVEPTIFMIVDTSWAFAGYTAHIAVSSEELIQCAIALEKLPVKSTG
jgi:hypothetical protein